MSKQNINTSSSEEGEEINQTNKTNQVGVSMSVSNETILFLGINCILIQLFGIKPFENHIAITILKILLTLVINSISYIIVFKRASFNSFLSKIASIGTFFKNGVLKIVYALKIPQNKSKWGIGLAILFSIVVFILVINANCKLNRIQRQIWQGNLVSSNQFWEEINNIKNSLPHNHSNGHQNHQEQHWKNEISNVHSTIQDLRGQIQNLQNQIQELQNQRY